MLEHSLLPVELRYTSRPQSPAIILLFAHSPAGCIILILRFPHVDASCSRTAIFIDAQAPWSLIGDQGETQTLDRKSTVQHRWHSVLFVRRSLSQPGVFPCLRTKKVLGIGNTTNIEYLGLDSNFCRQNLFAEAIYVRRIMYSSQANSTSPT